MARFCSNCGSEVGLDDNVCGNCGNVINNNASIPVNNSQPIQNNQTEENKIADNSLIVDVETDSVITQEKRDIILGFAGDINLDENWSTTIHLQEKNNDIEQCIDKEILDDFRKSKLIPK